MIKAAKEKLQETENKKLRGRKDPRRLTNQPGASVGKQETNKKREEEERKVFK